MFVRTKTFVNKDGSKRIYLQIAKSVWENGKPHQRVICTLGRLKDLKRGGMDTLIRGLSKFSEKLEVVEISKDLLAKDDKEYGAPLIFKRLFKLLGLEDILYAYLSHHNHVFLVKEAIFAVCDKIKDYYNVVKDPRLEGSGVGDFPCRQSQFG